MVELSDPRDLYGLAAALGVGLLIGIEREKSKGAGPDRAPAGVRTFALTALTGAVGRMAIGSWGIVLAVFVVGAFAVAAYLRSQSKDPGITTEVALVLTCMLGGLAHVEPAMGAMLGVLVALLLVSRGWLHSLVRDHLGEQEITDAVLLAAAALVILPVLPNRTVDPFGVINPRVVWALAVVVMSINAAGYVAVRALGARAGLPLAGLAGGFASSAATIGVMGQRARTDGSLARPAVAGAALSSVATIVELVVIVTIANRALLTGLWPSLLAAGLVALAYGVLVSWRAWRESGPSEGAALGRAFQPRIAILFAASITAAMFIAAALGNWLGAAGSVAGISLAGFADAHASAASAASLAANGRLAPAVAITTILLAFSTNTVTKMAVAWFSGGSPFALRLFPGLVLMLAAAWLAAMPGLISAGR